MAARIVYGIGYGLGQREIKALFNLTNFAHCVLSCCRDARVRRAGPSS